MQDSDRDDSLWTDTLASFCDEVGSASPTPAAVAVSAVTATLGLALLIKVLEIVGRRKSFGGDVQNLRALIDAARLQSQRLRKLADDDVAAVGAYLKSSQTEEGKRQAQLDAIEAPIAAARAAVAGIDLCAEAAGTIEGLTQGLLAADLGAAVLLLSAAVQAILMSVDFNLRQLAPGDAYRLQITLERHELEQRVSAGASRVTTRL